MSCADLRLIAGLSTPGGSGDPINPFKTVAAAVSIPTSSSTTCLGTHESDKRRRPCLGETAGCSSDLFAIARLVVGRMHQTCLFRPDTTQFRSPRGHDENSHQLACSGLWEGTKRLFLTRTWLGLFSEGRIPLSSSWRSTPATANQRLRDDVGGSFGTQQDKILRCWAIRSMLRFPRLCCKENHRKARTAMPEFSGYPLPAEDTADNRPRCLKDTSKGTCEHLSMHSPALESVRGSGLPRRSQSGSSASMSSKRSCVGSQPYQDVIESQ
jgi:hypothetical protein